MMLQDQLLTLFVLIAVIAAMIWDRIRSDVVALAGAAVLLVGGVVTPQVVQGAFASPAIIALASLFVIVFAMELSGLLDWVMRGLQALCRRIGQAGIWITILVCGGASAFLNNTPLVVLASPIIRDAAEGIGLRAKRFLIPLSYAAILGGGCTLIGTSTNLLVDDMAASAGQPRFGLFEITSVGIIVAAAGALYLLLFSGKALEPTNRQLLEANMGDDGPAAGIRPGSQVGDFAAFAEKRRLQPFRAFLTVMIFGGVIASAAYGLAPIAATAFAGAVLLILLRVISADEAYRGLRPDVLMLIAGMLVLGLALEETGLAGTATKGLVNSLDGLSPLLALIILYGATLLATEILSNATVAVLFTPIAIAMGEALAVSPRPFIVAVMMAGSAAFATPFGYQTNVIVYRLGGYRYVDFLRVGLPLNLITWAVAVVAISYFFPF